MRELPHAPGYTLNADALMGPADLIGFAIAHHPLSVFEHYHDFFELALVLQGTGLHITADGGRMVRRGTAIFVAPGVSHGYEMCAGLTVYNCFLRVEAVQFDMPWAPRDGRLGRLFSPVGMTPHLPIVVVLDEPSLSTCLGHLDAIRDRDAADRSEAHDLGHLLLALDILASRLEHDDTEHVTIDPRAPSILATAIELIDQDLNRHWTLDELAGRLCIGPFHLVRLFKRWTGMPPIAWSNRRRAERAAILLSTSDEPVAAIGAQVGWPDPSYFSRRFRREFGVGARTFRDRSHEHQAALHPGTPGPASAGVSGDDLWVPPAAIPQAGP